MLLSGEFCAWGAIAECAACLVLAALFILQHRRFAAVDKHIAAILRVQQQQAAEARQQTYQMQRFRAKLQAFSTYEAEASDRLRRIEASLARIEGDLAAQRSPPHLFTDEEEQEEHFEDIKVEAWLASTMRVPQEEPASDGGETRTALGRKTTRVDAWSAGRQRHGPHKVDKHLSGDAAWKTDTELDCAAAGAREVITSKSTTSSRRNGRQSTDNSAFFVGEARVEHEFWPLSQSRSQSFPSLTVVAEEEPNPRSKLSRSSSSANCRTLARTDTRTVPTSRSSYFNEAPPTPLAPPSTPVAKRRPTSRCLTEND